MISFYYFLGVGGNLVAVQASRLSTSLHKRATLGTLPKDAIHGCPNIISTYFSKGERRVEEKRENRERAKVKERLWRWYKWNERHGRKKRVKEEWKRERIRFEEGRVLIQITERWKLTVCIQLIVTTSIQLFLFDLLITKCTHYKSVSWTLHT